MFHDQGNGYEEIAGLRCYIPQTPQKHLIAGYELKKKDQKWRRIKLPDFYEERRLEEEYKQEIEQRLVNEGKLREITHIDPVLEKFRVEQWLRRYFGYWFYNNGTPTYITGAHYYYLNWCQFDHQENEGYPLYYDSSRRRFYFREYCAEDPRCLGYIIIGSRGFGKALRNTTNVWGEKGLVEIGRLSVSDRIYGDDGKLTTVTGVFPQGKKQLFRFHLRNGQTIDCCDDHLWKVIDNEGKEKILSTSEIRSDYLANPRSDGRRDSKYFIPLGEGVDFSEKNLPIDPYLLGLLIGDGSLTGNLCISNPEPEIRKEIAEIVGNDYILKDRGGKKKDCSYNIVWKYTRSINPLYKIIRELGLNCKSIEKHIPEKYLMSSRRQRLSLLQGLMDTDGYAGGSCGMVEYSTSSPQLSEDFKLLLNSLGIKFTMAEKQPPNGELSYRFTIKTNLPIFRLKRKKDNHIPYKKYLASLKKSALIKVEKIDVDEATCIKVDNQSRCFLLENGVVTHNTTEEVGAMLENMTRPPHRRAAAIQSKSKEDAKDVIFQEKMVQTFNALPEFFKPVSSHGSNPQNGLYFFRYAIKGKHAKKVKFGKDKELQNRIGCVTAKEKALDGKTLSDALIDEVGKTSPTEEADVYKRHHVNWPCFYRNSRKTGVMRVTSTVEEMEEGGKETFKIWTESNIEVRSENGFTLSRLYRMFVSALEVTHDIDKKGVPIVDEHGVVDIERARVFHQSERKVKEHDPIDLNKYIRKFPITVDEAFIKDAEKCWFNAMIINKRIQELNVMEHKPYIRGNFYPVTGDRDGIIDFERDDVSGRFLVNFLLTGTGEEFDKYRKLANNVDYEYDTDGSGELKKMWLPKNDKYFGIGTDPIKASKTKDIRASKAGAHGFRKYDDDIDKDKPISEWLTHMVMFEYQHRPDEFEVYAEDMIMACRYYGCSINPESNVTTLNLYFKQRGYDKFITKRKDFDDTVLAGKKDDTEITTTPEVINNYVTRIQAFINRHGHRFPFPETLKQLVDFDPSETQKYDLVVSLGYTLLQIERIVEEDTPVDEYTAWMDEYQINGNISELVDDEYEEEYEMEDDFSW